RRALAAGSWRRCWAAHRIPCAQIIAGRRVGESTAHIALGTEVRPSGQDGPHRPVAVRTRDRIGRIYVARHKRTTNTDRHGPGLDGPSPYGSTRRAATRRVG